MLTCRAEVFQVWRNNYVGFAVRVQIEGMTGKAAKADAEAVADRVYKTLEQYEGIARASN